MIISQKCKYALKAIMELASKESTEPVKIQDIASAQVIPIKFLEGILNDLRHAGIVDSKRGNEGGYFLVRKSSDLTVGEVVRQMQGRPESLISESKKDGMAFGEAAISKLCHNIVSEIDKIYNQTTFADLIEWEQTERQGEANFVI